MKWFSNKSITALPKALAITAALVLTAGCAVVEPVPPPGPYYATPYVYSYPEYPPYYATYWTGPAMSFSYYGGGRMRGGYGHHHHW